MKCGLLGNDWKYIIHNNDCLKTVTILILFRAGSINELDRERGLSHFIEHLFFQGTTGKLKNSKDITQTIYKHGGYLNAFTSHHLTSYFIKIDANHFEEALKVLSEMLFRSKFAADDLKREKKIVVQENRKHRSEPYRVLNELSYQQIYQGTPLAHDIGGDDRKIQKFNRAMIVKYLTEQYREAVVSVAGKLPSSQKKTIELLEKYLGKKMNYSQTTKSVFNPKRQPLKLPVQTTYRIKHVVRDFPETYVSVGFPICDHSVKMEKEKAACDILGVILAGNMSSRLFMKLREKHQYVYSIKYYTSHYEIGGDFNIQCGTTGKYIKPVVSGILDELESIKRQGIKKNEFQQAIDYKVGQLILSTEDSKDIAYYQGYYYLFLDQCRTIEDSIRQYKKLKLKDVQDVAKKIFDINKLNLSIISNNQ